MIEIKEIRNLEETPDDNENNERVIAYNGISYIHQFGMYWVDLDKRRPAVVLTNNWFNAIHKKVLIAPMTSKDKYNHVSNEFRDTYIEVISFDGYLSYINIGEIQLIEKTAITQRSKNGCSSYIGQITDVDCINNLLNTTMNIFDPSYNEVRISSSFQFNKVGGRDLVTRNLNDESTDSEEKINSSVDPILLEELDEIIDEPVENELAITIIDSDKNKDFKIFPYTNIRFKEMYEECVIGYDNNMLIIDVYMNDIIHKFLNQRLSDEDNLKILQVIAILLFKGKDLNRKCFDNNDSKRKKFESSLFEYIKTFEIVTPELYQLLDTYRSSNRKKSFYEVVKNM